MKYIKVTSKGSYFVGGEKVTIEGKAPVQMEYWPGGPVGEYDPNGDFQAGQMYVQYTRIADPVTPYPVCMIHGGGGTGALWETTQKGDPGWEYMFLENGFNVNISDGVERGRSSWAKYPEIYAGPPMFCSYAERWAIYRLGEKLGESYEGSRFDASKFDDFVKSQVPRWTCTIPMAQKAYNEYVDSMKDGCILLAHSQGGLFTLNAALEHPENVKAVVLVESSSTLNVNEVDVSAFKDIPFLFVWGDFVGPEYVTENFTWLGEFAYEDTMRNLHNKILEMGGNSTWIHLPEIGIKGNTHAMMQEDNSREIADIIYDWLKKNV